MSEKALIKVEYSWLNGYAFQDHGEMFYVRRAFLKKGSDESKIIIAHKRLLEIQEELLRRQKASPESWQIDYVDRLKSRILETKKLLSIYAQSGNPATVLTSQIAPLVPAQKETSELTTDQEYLGKFSVAPAKEPMKKKPRQKSNKTLFLESFEIYLTQVNTRPAVQTLLKDMIRHPKLISGQSQSRKEYLATKLEGYREQASQKEMIMFDDILIRLLEQTEIDEWAYTV